MKYLCLIYDNEAQQSKMTKEEGGKMMGEYRDFTQDITKSGHYLGGNPLQPTSTATTVRSRGGKSGRPRSLSLTIRIAIEMWPINWPSLE